MKTNEKISTQQDDHAKKPSLTSKLTNSRTPDHNILNAGKTHKTSNLKYSKTPAENPKKIIDSAFDSPPPLKLNMDLDKEELLQYLINNAKVIDDLKREIQTYKVKNEEIHQLRNKIKFYEHEIETRDIKLQSIKSDHQIEISKLQSHYDGILEEQQNEINFMNHKYDQIEQHGRYISELEKLNGELEKEIQFNQAKFNEQYKGLSLRTQVKIDKVKMDMMKVLVSQKEKSMNYQKELVNKLTLNQKLYSMQNIELFNELHQVSLEYHKLLESNKKLKTKIRNLEATNEIHDNLEQKLLISNRSLRAKLMLESISQKASLNKTLSANEESILNTTRRVKFIKIDNSTINSRQSEDWKLNIDLNSESLKSSKKKKLSNKNKFNKLSTKSNLNFLRGGYTIRDRSLNLDRTNLKHENSNSNNFKEDLINTISKKSPINPPSYSKIRNKKVGISPILHSSRSVLDNYVYNNS